MKFSVIIPAKGYLDSFSLILKALVKQRMLIHELIIIDSSSNNRIKSLCTDFSTRININYIKGDYYPGEARNHGVLQAKSELIAFLDSKTIPKNDWLSNAKSTLDQNVKCIFGYTTYRAETGFQEILQASIFGKKPVETLPGSVMHKEYFIRCGFFLEGVRAGEDFEWRDRFKNLFPDNHTTFRTSQITYNSISKKFLIEAKRQFIYQMHSALVDIQSSGKAFVLGTFLLLLSLIIPRWNAIVGWDSSPYYINDITKNYFYILCLVFIIAHFLKLFSRIFRKILGRFFLLIFLFFISYFVFFWNDRIADWDMSSFLYIPHITKIYVLTLCLVSIIYRGIVFPIRKGFAINNIFPFWWMRVGLIGFLLDLCKFPGYLLGGILVIFPAIKRKILK